jgi:hypothetical protein
MEMLFPGTERIVEYEHTNCNALGFVGINKTNAVSRGLTAKIKFNFFLSSQVIRLSCVETAMSHCMYQFKPCTYRSK